MLNLDVRKWAIQNFPLLISEDLTDLEIMYRILGEFARMNTRIDQLPQEVQASVNNWIEAHPEVFTIVYDGTITNAKLADKAVTPAKLSDYINQKLDSITDIRADVAQNANGIAVNTARIDNIVALPEGSTTGDAELADIRTGYNGTTYDTAGNAVRRQISDIHMQMEVEAEGYVYMGIPTLNHYWDAFGVLQPISGFKASPLIPIPEGMKNLEFSDFTGINTKYCGFYDSDKDFIGNFESDAVTLGFSVVGIPDNAAYFTVSAANNTYDNIRIYNREGFLEKAASFDRGYWILIGDSYAVGGNTWADKLKADLFGRRTVVSSVGGSGFRAYGSGKNFMTLLEDAETQIPCKDAVVGIIAAGGWNEQQYVTSEVASFAASFASYVKANYRNAKLYTAMIGHDRNTVTQAKLMSDILPIYQKTGIYLVNSEYILSDDLMNNTDGFHPTAEGQESLGRFLSLAVRAGSSGDTEPHATKRDVSQLSESIDDIAELKVSSNLYNFDDITANALLEKNGTLVEYSGYQTSGYINVEEGHTVYFRWFNTNGYIGNINAVRILFYKDDNSIINSAWSYNPVTEIVVPAEATKMRYTMNASVPERVMVTSDIVPTAFEEYYDPFYSIKEKIYYIGTNRDFSTLKDCTEYIIDNKIVGSTVYVDSGIYDLVSEFGEDYLNSIRSQTNTYFGLVVGNKTHFVFDAGSKVVFHYAGNNADCASYFSPFNIIGDVVLENLDIECSNARYCVHEDYLKAKNRKVIYKNCSFKHDGITISGVTQNAPLCIGGGTSDHSLSVIDGGLFTSAWALADVSYHNHNGESARIIIKDASFRNAIRLSDYANSNVDVIVSGCNVPNGIVDTHTKFHITEWNNSFSDNVVNNAIQNNFHKVESSNLFDDTSLIVGKWLNPTKNDGTLSDNESYSTTGFIDAIGNKTVYASIYAPIRKSAYIVVVQFYDENKNIISDETKTWVESVSVPTNAVYMRISVQNSIVDKKYALHYDVEPSDYVYEPYFEPYYKANTVNRLEVPRRKDQTIMVKTCEHIVRKPTITVIADDGYFEDYSKLLPVAQAFDVPFCIALAEGHQITIDNILHAQNDLGWEFISHPLNTDLSLCDTEKEIEDRMIHSLSYLDSIGVKCFNLAYPYGGNDERVRRIAKKYFRCAVTTVPNCNTGIVGSFTLNRRALGSFYSGDGTFTNEYKAYVDEIINNNGWLILMLHPQNPQHDANQQEQFRQTIQYAVNNGVDILTLNDAYDRFGNVLEVGDYVGTSTQGFAISKTGEFSKNPFA